MGKNTNNSQDYKIILTGFGPFNEHIVNASWEVVKIIKEIGIRLPAGEEEKRNIKIIIEEIPVIYDVVKNRVPALWKEHKPDLVIHIGVSGLAKLLQIEQCAHNYGYCTPDTINCLPNDNTCVEDGCDTIVSGFNVQKVVNYVNSLSFQSLSNCSTEKPDIIPKVQVEMSNDPGRFLCDFTYYTSLNINKERSLFIHVPPLNNPYSALQLAKTISVCITQFIKQTLET